MSYKNSFDNWYETLSQLSEDIDAEEIDYSLCSWFKLMTNWCTNLLGYRKVATVTAIFQDTSDKVYSIQLNYRNKTQKTALMNELINELKKASVPVESDLVAVNCYTDDSSHSTYDDTHCDTYISISNKANAEAIKQSGVNAPLPKPAFGHADEWEELTKAEVGDRKMFLIDGMDKWYYQSTTYYTTD